MRSLFKSIFVILTFVMGVTSFGTMQTMAQGAVKSSHGAWSMVCDTPPGAASEQCALMQILVSEAKPELGLTVVALRTADRQKEFLRVQAPLGVLLPFGVGLNIDGKDFGRAYFVRCFKDGCYIEVALAGDLLTSLQKGNTATLIVFQTPEEGIGFPVDLSGFSDGYSKIP